MRWPIVLFVLSLTSTALADVFPPPECPHALPASGASCRAGGPDACTYPTPGGRTICTCRDGAWACTPLPPAPHS